MAAGIAEELASFEAVFDRRDLRGAGACWSGARPPRRRWPTSSPFYGLSGRTFALYHYFESRMLEKHLDRLVEEGRAARGEDGFYSLKK